MLELGLECGYLSSRAGDVRDYKERGMVTPKGINQLLGSNKVMVISG